MPSTMPAALGLLVLTAAVFGLASTDFVDGTVPDEISAMDTEVDAILAKVQTMVKGRSTQVVDTVVNQVVPESIPDGAAIALSEGFAGAASASFLYGARVVVSTIMFQAMQMRRNMEPGAEELLELGSEEDMAADMEGDFTEAVAVADYFYAKTALTATLQALEVPLAPVAGVVLAQVPYQLVKLRSRLEGGSAAGMRPMIAEKDRMKVRSEESVNFMGIDGVDAVADLLKWIEYDILVADFGDTIENDLSGVGSAGFGALAALSSQVYKDITVAAGYGRQEARKEQSERTFRDWVAKYVVVTGSSALLFGLYETLRQPLTQVALSIFSGGAVACWGSANADLCNDVYLLDALPSAILQALTGVR